MAMSTTANGRMIKHTDTEYITTLTALATKVIGTKTNNMERARKFGQTVLSMRATIRKERSTDSANSTGPMDLLTPVSLSTTTFTDRAFTLGLMDVDTMANG